MEYSPRPEVENAKIDFSQFHPLDHSILRCADYPGGLGTHLKYSWEFRWRPRIRALIRCKIGFHDEAQSWQRSGDQWSTGTVCLACFKSLSAYQPE